MPFERLEQAPGSPELASWRPKPASVGPWARGGGRMDGWTYRFPLCSTGLPPPLGPKPCLPKGPTLNKLLSRARVPMTISCLWATGYLLFLLFYFSCFHSPFLFLLFFLGFGPEGGRSPVEHRGNLYIHLSVRPSIPPSLAQGLRGWLGPPKGLLRAPKGLFSSV